MDDYFDLGSFTWPMATEHPEAQRWLNSGMVWCFGYNHEEAIACFEKALALDPDCTLARFGITSARADVPITASCFCRLDHAA